MLLAAGILGGLSACSKDRNPARPDDSGGGHGTRIAAARTIDPESTLLWSAHTNELIVSAAAFSDGGLLAIHSGSGAPRILDSALSVPLALAPDGSAAYYLAISAGKEDSIHARRVTLNGPSSPRTLLSCPFLCFFLMEPAPDGDRVAIGTGDSLLIHQLTNGRSTALTEGWPMEFSPDASRLLVNGFFDPLSAARIVTLANRASEPAMLGVPDTMGAHHIRWTGAGGLEVLFVSADRRSLWKRRVHDGVTDFVWQSPDTLQGPLAWSPNLRFVAVWSARRLASGSDRWVLHGIDLENGTERVLAFGESGSALPSRNPILRRLAPAADIFPPPEPRGLAFSPNSSQVAYSWLDGSLYRVSWTASVAALQ